MLRGLLGSAAAVFVAALAVFLAVRLIESVAVPLLVITGVIAALVAVTWLVRLWWGRRGPGRW